MLACFRGFKACLFYFVIFHGHVVDYFSNQYNKVIYITKLQYITLCSWMVKGKLMLSFKLSKNTQTLGDEHYNRIIMFRSLKTNGNWIKHNIFFKHPLAFHQSLQSVFDRVYMIKNINITYLCKKSQLKTLVKISRKWYLKITIYVDS